MFLSFLLLLSMQFYKKDMFLLGKVGPYRRHLALSFAEMLQKEVEIVTITQDTTEVNIFYCSTTTTTGSISIY